MKKFCISCLAALVLTLNVAPVAVASPSVSISSAEEGGVARIEETRWYFRTTPEGKNEMRLWSVTYGVWLTDWIPVGP